MGALKLINQSVLGDILGITEGRAAAPACEGSSLLKTLKTAPPASQGLNKHRNFCKMPTRSTLLLPDASYKCDIFFYMCHLCFPR